ncbi:MAG: hypothetical protein ACYDAO_02895 [Thermoplasmataceae archaeon]
MSINIISFLSPLGAFILSSEISSSYGLWILIFKYGLGQPYAFPFSSSVIDRINPLLGHLTNLLSIPVATATIAICSIRIMLARKGEDVNRIAFRLVLSMMFFLFAIDVSKFILETAYLVFSSVWDYGSINWLNSMTSTQVLDYLRNFSTGGNTLSAILLSSGYFAATFFLLSFLMLRDALLITLMVILPLASLIMGISEAYDRVIQLWTLFVELAIIPFPIAITLYLSYIYSGVFFMHLAFLWASCLIPSLLITKGGLFRNLMGLDILSGITFLGNRMPIARDNIPNIIPSTLGNSYTSNNSLHSMDNYNVGVHDLMKSDIEYRRVME